jgi:hypothetical protein
MQDVHQGSVRPPAVMAGMHLSAAQALPYRRAQSFCNDGEFIAALDAYRPSGGLLPAEELLSSFRRRCGHELATLARWIVARQVVSFTWQARTWLPMFQFNPDDMTPRSELTPVMAELSAAFDDWEAAQWFVTPNAWLGECTPVALVAVDVPAVLLAARAVPPASARERSEAR